MSLSETCGTWQNMHRVCVRNMWHLAKHVSCVCVLDTYICVCVSNTKDYYIKVITSWSGEWLYVFERKMWHLAKHNVCVCVCVLDTYITRYQRTTKVTLQSLHVGSFFQGYGNINCQENMGELVHVIGRIQISILSHPWVPYHILCNKENLVVPSKYDQQEERLYLMLLENYEHLLELSMKHLHPGVD